MKQANSVFQAAQEQMQIRGGGAGGGICCGMCVIRESDLIVINLVYTVALVLLASSAVRFAAELRLWLSEGTDNGREGLDCRGLISWKFVDLSF